MSAADPLAWWQRGAIYQIYPRSFADSNGDGVGDLPGIVERLDYVSSLGVEAVWLSPFFPSPMADFGYDVSSYTDVDPVFGTLDDFDRLLSEAHRRSIRVVIDWVPNHTSDRHPWFLESRSSRDSPKRDWYVWRDPAPGGGPPNNWRSVFPGVGPAWRFDEQTGEYYLHSFLPEQPDLNWENPQVEAAMHEVLRFWLRRGVDGFRVDVTHKLGKDPELADNTGGPRHDQDWPTVHERLRGIRRVVDEFEDRMIVGEVYLRDLRRVVEYVKTGDQLHLAHNFVFLNLPWDAAAFRVSVDDFERLAERTTWPAWFLANHDHSRVASRYDEGGGSGVRRARAAALLTTTMRGTPFLYQGEELGLPDADVPPDLVVDVDGRDPQRAPLPWIPPSSAGEGGGFTSGRPWLPLVADAERLCMESQDADPDSTLNLVRRLLTMRRRRAALQAGSQRSVDAATGLFAYLRELDERLLAVVNFTAEHVPLGSELAGPATVELSTDPAREQGGAVRLERLVLEPDEGLLLRLT